MNVTAPAASPDHLNQLMIDAIADARPVGTSDPRVLNAIRAVPRHAFEAGAGTGWNAALLAALAGTGGYISTIDIDPEISAQAAFNLERAGFPGVHVATGDAGLGVPENAPYDRAIITIGSLDIPPAWFSQLRPGGRLVVPLRWRGQTQSVALVLGEDSFLRSDTVFLCGFVPMIGQGWERSSTLDSGKLTYVHWDADQDISPGLLSAPVIRSRTMALAEGDSIAYLAAQRLQAPEHGARLGAIGQGPDGASLAERLCHPVGAGRPSSRRGGHCLSGQAS